MYFSDKIDFKQELRNNFRHYFKFKFKNNDQFIKISILINLENYNHNHNYNHWYHSNYQELPVKTVQLPFTTDQMLKDTGITILDIKLDQIIYLPFIKVIHTSLREKDTVPNQTTAAQHPTPLTDTVTELMHQHQEVMQHFLLHIATEEKEVTEVREAMEAQSVLTLTRHQCLCLISDIKHI